MGANASAEVKAARHETMAKAEAKKQGLDVGNAAGDRHGPNSIRNSEQDKLVPHNDGRLGKRRSSPGLFTYWKMALFYALYVTLPVACFAGWVSLFCLHSHSNWQLVMLWNILFVVACFGFALTRKFPAPAGQFETALVSALMGITALVSIGVGRYIYTSYFASYDEFGGLVTYVNIDPAADKGAAYTDAGEVYFKEGARVDTSHTVAYVAGEVYCLAPIVRDAGAPATVMDWFVVGTNCCQPPLGELFACADPKGRSGLRLLDDARRPMFALAVDEWTSQYNIPAAHPLFFEWVVDPHAEVMSLRLHGWLLVSYVSEACAVLLVVIVAWSTFWIEEIRSALVSMHRDEQATSSAHDFHPSGGYGSTTPMDEARRLADERHRAFLENRDDEDVIAQAMYEDAHVAQDAAAHAHRGTPRGAAEDPVWVQGH